MKNTIYPKRYGKWNNNIKLIDYLKFPEILEKNQFDLIIIGTPPHTHLKIFKKLNKYKIKNILVENINFLETLAEKIINIIFDDRRIIKINIKIEKPDAVSECDSVGYEITKERM